MPKSGKDGPLELPSTGACVHAVQVTASCGFVWMRQAGKGIFLHSKMRVLQAQMTLAVLGLSVALHLSCLHTE